MTSVVMKGSLKMERKVWGVQVVADFKAVSELLVYPYFKSNVG